MIRLSSPIFAFLLLLFSIAAPHAPAAPTTQVQRQAILVTIGPGDEIWERFGHNLIWVIDRQAGLNTCYNWGLFDFEEPDFLIKFIQGRMMYWMDGLEPEPSLGLYYQQNRSITLQRLRLSDAQLDDLIARCETNRLPANRIYPYDYYTQNCSTMVRDMLDAVTGGALAKELKDQQGTPQMTLRQHTLRAARHGVWLSLGMDLLMSTPTDRPLTKWEESFLPEKLSAYATPIVEAELPAPWTSTREPEPDGVPDRTAPLLSIGVLIASFTALTARGRSRWSRRAALIASCGWWAFSGTAGALMLYLWLFTNHTAAHANQNLFHFSAAGLLIVLLVLASNRWPRLSRAAAMLGTAVLMISLIGLLLRVIGVLHQDNVRMILLAFPANLATAYAAWRLTRSRPATEVTATS
ncbi:MAG TPA: DUF4105 domain-containing protein [Tepidisphaeraceae bacterium]